jgi:hypothetical protein
MKWWQSLLGISQAAGPLFGDQSLFVKTDVFATWAASDVPLMEDIEFEAPRRITPLISVWSSPRRFRRFRGMRAILLVNGFNRSFYLGISPETLHRWYYGRRYDQRRSAKHHTVGSSSE